MHGQLKINLFLTIIALYLYSMGRCGAASLDSKRDAVGKEGGGGGQNFKNY